MADVKKMIEQREKLERKIKEEKKKEYEKFGRWFFNKLDVNSSAEAKKIINEELLNNVDNIEENNYNDTSIIDSRNENNS
ncbi:hypothetical protein P1A20_14010 [Staphylococcus equorum]|uniref:hypothetical protein n=1 Tax=Staphylococcus equorum TaxID=246432 RepID=UPI002556FDF1|nr:hypothetical protein [Staphylococcus equorum]MDK9847690.1 hypothetical protein [Staphylococcus equorum]